VDPAALAVTRRADGTQQATYHGHPLYFFLGDSKPGEINCQDAEEYGGHWWLLRPNGAENRSSP
jgi:predicted lipoprotein with Yx(FWY)xxD motif